MSTDDDIYNIPIPAPVALHRSESVYVDDNVAICFTPGARIISALPHGASFWARTARIDVDLEDGTKQSLFLKINNAANGKGMSRGEFEGVSSLYQVVGQLVPRPIAWGEYKSEPGTYFYLAEYVDMTHELPSMQDFCKGLAQLHKDSAPLSPDGRFGFHETTYEGCMYQDVGWCDRWEDLYVRAIRDFARQEKEVHGPSDELDALLPPLLEKVIPRLLRPLQTNGRSIQPVLVHGDIWYGNISTNAKNGLPVMFDPSVFWAHNEYDLGNFNVPRYRLGREWMNEYHKHMPISSPEEDYEDRNVLYAIHAHFCASTLDRSTTKMRRLAIDEIRKLVEKYPEGYEDVEDTVAGFNA
ncbi:MAG: hypothetical protein M1828_002721 [Chrysothrix sp. TS-e1954]|nr:MAG: hypothetical protein M1828_002721 [Chrysothrix sp. TS-e1954]